MKVAKKTPRTEMAFAAVIAKMGTIYESLGEELGYGAQAVDEQLSTLARISIRIIPDKGDFDFEMVNPADTAEIIKAKFLRYIETAHYSKVEQALRELAVSELPLTLPEQAPAIPEDAPKN